MGEELKRASAPSSSMRATRSSERSNDRRCAITETASAAEAWVFAQRASRFRLLPIRAIWLVRSRSTARADAVHVRVCAMARRNNSDGDTPAAAAFSRQAACSAGVTRAATITVRCSGMSTPTAGFGGGAPARPLLQQRRDREGVRRGARPPLPAFRVQHGVGWLTHLKGAGQPTGKRAGRLAATGISGRRNLHAIHGEARFRPCQPPESRRFPKTSSAVPEPHRPPPAAPPTRWATAAGNLSHSAPSSGPSRRTCG